MNNKNSIDDDVDRLFQDDNPTAEAVRSLINVTSRKKGENSEVELKTDLNLDEIKLHTVLETLGLVLEDDHINFNSKCILLNLIEKKERKSISKDRQSRSEIVAIARQPDQILMPGQEQNPGMLKKFFTSKKNREQQY